MNPVNPARRIVTANVDGKSVVARDEIVDPIEIGLAPGGGFTRLFGTLSLTLPESSEAPEIVPYYPPAGGVTVTIVTLPPDPKEPPPAGFDTGPLIAEAEEKLPGIMSGMEPNGMQPPRASTS